MTNITSLANITSVMEFKLLDFNIYNSVKNTDEPTKGDPNKFYIQMFGINEKRETYSIIVENYQPFFYVKVGDNWNERIKDRFFVSIRDKIGKYYSNSFDSCELVQHKKLYGFDAGKLYNFVKLSFHNISCFNKVKNLWYTSEERDEKGNILKDDRGFTIKKLLESGVCFERCPTFLYESNIPPLLRYFHIQNISPSGWVSIPMIYAEEVDDLKTSCTFEYTISYDKIVPLDRDDPVPYKICSFDIEASSSHGDFPLPIKTYKKLAVNIVSHFLKHEMTDRVKIKTRLFDIIRTAFGYGSIPDVDLVFPKRTTSLLELEEIMTKWISVPINQYRKTKDIANISILEKYYENQNKTHEVEEIDEDVPVPFWLKDKEKVVKARINVIDLLLDKKTDRDAKINTLVLTFDGAYREETGPNVFPKLEGDKVTFIGSTFLISGESEPYLNHCVVLNDCDSLKMKNSVIETYSTETRLLLAWKDLINRENPDIIIGYNIFGFDYMFMFQRAKQCECVEEFLLMSRNKDELCGNRLATGEIKLEESNIKLASGTHELQYIKMTGRIQVDMYNHFRRQENLVSYKLDYVAGYFIGDYVKKYEWLEYEEEVDDQVITTDVTRIYTDNMTGIQISSFIHFEEIGHTTEYYKNGDKFQVLDMDKDEKWVDIKGCEPLSKEKKVRWCLAKDDVTPQDIFKMTNGKDSNSSTRATIAKYCIQDCNLVHHLFSKVDVLTGFVEMAKICSVPISYLIMRGQGIKLTSYVAKKCREKNTLMPVIEKGNMDEGYEGAIVLEPKCFLYLDNPVACVDYGSLYPSSMISEELSHDSKVWSKSYDLSGEFLGETGEKVNGEFIYDNLKEYTYVDITYDTYAYVKKTPSSASEKIKTGYRICRFAQFPKGTKSVMPSILEELLVARKTTRKMILTQTDEFMKNVLDKRQLAYKITANSLYGQCGAKTSSFYEQDIAASTTAIGRLLLTYAKKVIESVYDNRICDTAQGQVKTKAEYIYGDTDSIFFTFNLMDLEGVPIRGKKALGITIELAQQAGAIASKFLKHPQDLEYEKTFMPFCLLSKKRYVGILYEHDVNKGKRKEMGIVLKRRDNAPIVKDIYGGIIDILMKDQNIHSATAFLKASLQDIIDKKCPMEKLIISKSLNSYYKLPQQIAHKVLADRIASRDPGNKPSVGDRIPFIYVHNSNKRALQGDKIETPGFIVENNIPIDYSFYITNQIMKPVQQLFSLVLEDIWRQSNKLLKLRTFEKECQKLKKDDETTYPTKLENLKNKYVKELLFDEFLRVSDNSKSNNKPITAFFK